uniref:Uncharacterized protein n=1 Tax=Gasterosteus aculeatus TaxID=69293 RepID=G3Q974_GASAC
MLFVEYHIEVPSSQGERQQSRVFPWKEKKFSLVKVHLQVGCGHPLRDVSQAGRDSAATCVSDWGKEWISKIHDKVASLKGGGRRGGSRRLENMEKSKKNEAGLNHRSF